MHRGAASAGLLERERELAAIERFVDAIGAPGPRLVLIEGAAGIGKTALLREARRLAESAGLRVLAARGSELEREFPYGLVRQLLEPDVTRTGASDRAFTGAAAAARPVFAAAPAGGEGEVVDSGFATLHGLYWLTLAVADEGPLVLAIDDLQWGDRPSLRYLAYLLRRLEDVAILLIATRRTRAAGEAPDLVAELAGDPLAISLGPAALSPEAVTEMILSVMGAEPAVEFAAECRGSTGGNPLLLRELLGALAIDGVEPSAANAGTVREIGPQAVARAVHARLSRVSPEAARVAAAAAVLGDGTGLSTLAALAELDAEVAAEEVAALTRAEILRADSPIGFVHPLIRDVVYAELPPAERELRHARAAALLREESAPAEQIAAHLLVPRSGGAEWAFDVLVDAGRAAAARGASESAVAYLARALEERPAEAERTPVLYELGLHELNTSGPEAAVHLGQAYADLSDEHRRADAAFNLAWSLSLTGASERARRVVADALAELPAGASDARFALEAVNGAAGLFGGGHVGDAAALLRHRHGVEGDGPGARMLEAIAAYTWAHTGGTAAECVPLARRALAGDVLLDRDRGLFWVLATNVLVYADDPRALDAWDAAQRHSHRSGSLFTAMAVHLWQGANLLRWGDLTGAETRLLQAKEELSLWAGGSSSLAEFPAAFLCEIRLERDDITGARSALTVASGFDAEGDGANFWRSANVALLTQEGRLEEALEACDEYEAGLPAEMNPDAHPWRTQRAYALSRLGRRDEAAELAREELELARRWGAPGPTGRALRLLGVFEGDDGLDHLRESVAVLDGSVRRLELALALCALGTRLRAERAKLDAREPLRRAISLATSCGAEQLLKRARIELDATGARSGREVLRGVESLSPSERRVAELAAAGRSNREIAQELFVTTKTVETHLSSTYRKLEINGRRALEGALEG